MPFSAPLPIPAINAVGVARPSAQGHAMIRMLMVVINAYVSEGSGPAKNQIEKVIAASTMTTGTKMAAILSTSF